MRLDYALYGSMQYFVDSTARNRERLFQNIVWLSIKSGKTTAQSVQDFPIKLTFESVPFLYIFYILICGKNRN